MKQLYSVGELVIICSTGYPEDNGGPYVVLKVDTGIGDMCTTVLNNTPYIQDEIAYKVDNGDSGLYMQRALKKYYPPSTKSFREIMSDLKKPVKA